VTIRDWLLAGLPNDGLSIDNAVIFSRSRRWPLCIDPQGQVCVWGFFVRWVWLWLRGGGWTQANKWIKAMLSDKKLIVLRLRDADYMRALANAVHFGTSLSPFSLFLLWGSDMGLV
jgi:dynein heavy chain